LNIAIIPARAGSKRIKNKNLKQFYGKPIIAWSIEEAIKSKCFDEVFVSTDSYSIAEVAKEYGAKVPFIRNSNLSDDHTGILDVIKDAIEQLSSIGYEFENVCCIFATAPFIESNYIHDGLKKIMNNNQIFVLSATTFKYPVQRSFTIDGKKGMQMLFEENYHTRTQDLSEVWHDAAQFYWGSKETWKNANKIFLNSSEIVKIPNIVVQDIDTNEDWKNAELVYKILNL
jgi:pseudaminic acid cytidylyltransferase